VTERVASDCGGDGLTERIALGLERAGKDFVALTTADLAPYNEFHCRGRKATLELAAPMNLAADSAVLDIGSGLGGAARTVAEAYGCHVTGIDLTPTSARWQRPCRAGSISPPGAASAKATPPACPFPTTGSTRR
jgi:SAM-dependent methyltransferase